MNYTFTPHTGDGSTQVFSFSLAGQDNGYVQRSDINVFVGGVAVPFTLSLQTPNQVTITTAPPVGAEILIRRIVPKTNTYTDFQSGNPFTADNLNKSFLQGLYLQQEWLDGFLPTGFYLKQDVDVGGHKLTNMADGTESGDAVTYDQWFDHEKRIDSLEDGAVDDTPMRTIPWYYIATGGESVLSPPYSFVSAIVFINGIFQNKNLGAYSVSGSKVNLGEPLVKGDQAYLLLGSGFAAPDDYATHSEVTEALSSANEYTDTKVEVATSSKADSGDNSDITSLSGLTVPLSISQGGLGASTVSEARVNLELTAPATANFGTTVGSVLEGNAQGRLLSPPKRFSANGTYTPSAGMASCIVEIVGGGGAGGGCPATSAAQVSAGAGGNSGSYARVFLTAAQVGASQAITIGAGGVPVSGAAGGAGGASSVGTLMSCAGGAGGGTTGAITAASGGAFVLPSARTSPTVTTGTTLNTLQSVAGEYGLATTTTTIGSSGANSPMGSGAIHVTNAVGASAPVNSGGGGGGAASPASTAARLGGTGGSGLVIIYEYS